MQAIIPNWNTPQSVRAFTTLRHGGVSLAPYDGFNLGDHVGDDKNAVKTNRTLHRFFIVFSKTVLSLRLIINRYD